jgi:hypothetical protein
MKSVDLISVALAGNYGIFTKQEKVAGNQKSLTGGPKKKEASWFRTILWMLSMMLLANVVMAILFYVLYHFKIIH